MFFLAYINNLIFGAKDFFGKINIHRRESLCEILFNYSLEIWYRLCVCMHIHVCVNGCSKTEVNKL